MQQRSIEAVLERANLAFHNWKAISSANVAIHKQSSTKAENSRLMTPYTKNLPGSLFPVAAMQICMYLPAYDKLSSYFNAQGAGSLSPLLAGSCARTAAVLATSPVELLKTRLQTAPPSSPIAGKAASSYVTVWQSLALHRQVGSLTFTFLFLVLPQATPCQL
jgi:hypothetical protein